MIIQNSVFLRLFGDGVPRGDTDLSALEYGSAADRHVVLALARCCAPKTVVEFGIQEGMTAGLLLDEIPSIETYVGIDLPRGKKPALAGQAKEVPTAPGKLVKEDERVKIIRKRSETLKPGDLPKADLIYVDGGHDLHTVVADTALARQIVNPGGVIIWHDYGNGSTEVQQVIDACNQAEGDHITLVSGTWVCFELNRGE